MPQPIIRRLNLEPYMERLSKKLGEEATAKYVADRVQTSHNTIMYYWKHYREDYEKRGRIKQPLYTLVVALADFFGVKPEDLIVWESPPDVKSPFKGDFPIPAPAGSVA